MIKKIALCLTGFMALQISAAPGFNLRATIKKCIQETLNVKAQDQLIRNAMEQLIESNLIDYYEQIIKIENPRYFNTTLDNDGIKDLQSHIQKRVQRDFSPDIACKAFIFAAQSYIENADWLTSQEKEQTLDSYKNSCLCHTRNIFKRGNGKLPRNVFKNMLADLQIESELF